MNQVLLPRGLVKVVIPERDALVKAFNILIAMNSRSLFESLINRCLLSLDNHVCSTKSKSFAGNRSIITEYH